MESVEENDWNTILQKGIRHVTGDDAWTGDGSDDKETWYSSTCHGRPTLVQRKNGPTWQVAPRDRERTYAPLCQIKHTHYFTANAQHFKAQRSITVLYTVRDETNNAENVWKINSIYSQCNPYMWTHTCAVLYLKICRSNRRRFEMSHGDWPL